MDVGKTYFFKDGEVKFINLTITEEELDKACDEIKDHIRLPLVSSEEHSLNSNINYTNTSTLEIYKQYIDAGYSVIRYTKIFDVDYEGATASLSTKCDCVVALNITEKDASNIQGIFETLEPKKAFDKGYIYNIHKNMFDEIDYDYYDPSQNRGILSSEILPYFLKEKTGSLTEEDKEVVNSYRNFNLEKLLTEDIPKEYKLNNDNAGMIVIAADNMYVSTCKKMQQKSEINMILGHINPDIDQNSTIMEFTENSRNIIIQVCKSELIIWIPKYIKSYQVDQLKVLIDVIRQIDSKIKEPISVSASVCTNGDYTPIIELNYNCNLEEANNALDSLSSYLDGINKNTVLRGSKII